MATDLTDEMIDYAVAYIEVGLRRRYGSSISKEDVEDLTQYCLAKLVRKWRLYDSQKSKWKTYICCILKSALLDAVKWHYRQHQRLQTVPIADEHDSIMDDKEDTVEKIIDEIFQDPITHDVALCKWQGHSQREICRKLKLSKQQYVVILADIHDKLQSRMGIGNLNKETPQ